MGKTWAKRHQVHAATILRQNGAWAMHRSLIVAKIVPGTERQVAEIWSESDRTELPKIAKIRHRSLYSLGDLYVHLLESEEPSSATLGAARKEPEFHRISERLKPYISAYLSTWQSPKDAVASCFYTWEPEEGAQ
jgi:cyclase